MKHPISTLLIFLLFFLLFSENTKAQNPTYPIVSMDIQPTAVAFATSGGLPDLSDSTIFRITMNVSLFDTTSIEQMYVVLSDSGGTGNRLTHTFDWDVSGNTGSGTTYVRSRYNVVLGLGNFKDLLNYTATVQIKRTDGTLTDLINFSR